MGEEELRLACLTLAHGRDTAADKVVAIAKTYADFVLGRPAKQPERPVIGIEPTSADVGRAVIYHGPVHAEEGVITTFNEHYVSVRFGDSQASHGKATRREDLSWAGPAVFKQVHD